MKNSLLVTLRVLIAALLVGALIVQAVTIPWMAHALSSDFPEVANLAIPYTAAAIAGIGCAQVVLVATWRLTLLVGSGSIFDSSALRWVTMMVRAAAVATVLTLAVALHATLVIGLGPVTVPLALCGGAVAAGAAWIILVIMRGLLAMAVAHKVELDEVV